MGSIIADIVDEIDVKPNKTKLILKWVLGISGSLIATAFLLGQLRTNHINRLDSIETNLVEMKVENRKGFTDVNTRIDKVYDDGLIMFNEFQKNNNQQLNLIIDYGDDNKDMLKQLLEFGRISFESQIERAKNENVAPMAQEPSKELEIVTKPMDYISEVHFIEVETSDTVFYLTGATKKYINKIDRNKYEVGAALRNEWYPDLYDVSYRKKR